MRMLRPTVKELVETLNAFCPGKGAKDNSCSSAKGAKAAESLPKTITAEDVGKLLESQHHNQLASQENILGHNPETGAAIYSLAKERFEAPYLQDKWVKSESFKLMEILIDAAFPTAPIHVGTESKSNGPIVVDINPGSYGRLHGRFGAPPEIVILDGKHRHATAVARGDKTIKAYVGDKAAAKLGIKST